MLISNVSIPLKSCNDFSDISCDEQKINTNYTLKISFSIGMKNQYLLTFILKWTIQIFKTNLKKTGSINQEIHFVAFILISILNCEYPLSFQKPYIYHRQKFMYIFTKNCLLNILTLDSSILCVGFVADQFYEIKCSFIKA